MMMVLYTVVIVGSAYLAGLLGTRTLARIGKQVGLPPHGAQLAMALSMIAFLTVVSVATGVVLAALVGALAWLVTRSVWLPLAAMALLATVGVWESPGSWPASVPVIGFLLLAALVFAASLAAARTAEMALPVLAGVTVAAYLPLLVAPVVFTHAHTSLALDAGIVLAALAGGAIVLPGATVSAALLRLPLAVLVAYGAIQAMHYGAWPLGVVSVLIWLAGLKLAPRALGTA